MPYPPSDPNQSIDVLEKQLLATWKHERLFTRVSDATRYGPPFIFYEGPPTANGRPGIHHVFSRTLKDLICRYHTMLGQGVTRIAGWDTHGLPVEIEVEKALNISGKRQIEAYGIERFNKLCRDSVFKYKTDWESLSDRIGLVLEHAVAAQLVEALDAVRFDLPLAADVERFLHLDLDRQAVGIPAGDARHALPQHRVVAADQVLERARKDVMDPRPPVGRRRAFIEDERRPVAGGVADAREQALVLPRREQLLLE